MKTAADTYLNDPEVIRRNSRARRAVLDPGDVERRTLPRWAAFAMLTGMTLLLCLTINYRAFSEMRRETNEHRELSQQIETLTTENLALQEEIHNLKSDSSLIDREARKLGLR